MHLIVKRFDRTKKKDKKRENIRKELKRRAGM